MIFLRRKAVIICFSHKEIRKQKKVKVKGTGRGIIINMVCTHNAYSLES